jgi:hypothetical protein
MTPVAPEALDHRLFFLNASGEGWRIPEKDRNLLVLLVLRVLRVSA